MSMKKGKKTDKRMRGVPVHDDELKKKHGVWLTDTAWELLREKAKEDGVIAREYLERSIGGLGDFSRRVAFIPQLKHGGFSLPMFL